MSNPTPGYRMQEECAYFVYVPRDECEDCPDGMPFATLEKVVSGLSTRYRLVAVCPHYITFQDANIPPPIQTPKRHPPRQLNITKHQEENDEGL